MSSPQIERESVSLQYMVHCVTFNSQEINKNKKKKKNLLLKIYEVDQCYTQLSFNSSFVYTGEARENVPGCTDLHHL